ncbi:MAG: hypothetical protein AAB336_06085 [Acidobacteriota bacterium]
MLVRKLDFEIFADYHQFYLEDETSPHDTGSIWTKETFQQMIAVSEKLVAVGTARNVEVPISIEIHDSEPILEIEKYSRINECSLETTSNKLILAGCTDYLPEAIRIEIEPAIYRVRVLYGNLETVKDEFEGEDFYILQLWKENEFREVKTLKI